MKKTKKLVAMLILSALIFGLMPMVSAATVFTKLPVQLKWGSSAAELEAAEGDLTEEEKKALDEMERRETGGTK